MSEPVLIVGAGPTGLTAALELARLGIPVRLIDKAAQASTTSRALGVQARTLELFQQRGLADEVLRLGHRAVAGSIYGGGARVARLDFSRVASRYNFLLLLSQAETERILREAVERHGVVVERGVELASLAQDALSHDPAPVRAVLRHKDGRLEQARCPWLISAEGAHSLVRTTLDLQFEGKTLSQAYALGDVQIDGDLPQSDLHLFSSAHGLLALFPLGGSRFRLIAGDAPGPSRVDSEPTLEDLQRLYDERSHIPGRCSGLHWSAWFRINSRMVPRLRIGRLLLGGDAAHIHSPAGGQGMNTGIQDMINLCWKLAWVIRGEAPMALLDSYEQDRLPVMRKVLARTEGLTAVIGSENSVVRSLITELGPRVTGSRTLQANAAAQISQVAVGYRHGPLSADHPHCGSLRAGGRVPDLAVRHRAGAGWAAGSLLALLDPSRLVLLVAHGSFGQTLDPALAKAVAGCGGLASLVELAPPAERVARGRYEAALGRRGSVFLVRPDAYVGLAAGAHAAARTLAAYCARWLTPQLGDQLG